MKDYFDNFERSFVPWKEVFAQVVKAGYHLHSTVKICLIISLPCLITDIIQPTYN